VACSLNPCCGVEATKCSVSIFEIRVTVSNIKVLSVTETEVLLNSSRWQGT